MSGPRLRFSIRGMIVAVAIAALASLGLAGLLQTRRENDPWANAVRYALIHEARARQHLEAAREFPETAQVRLINAKYEERLARDFHRDAKQIRP